MPIRFLLAFVLLLSFAPPVGAQSRALKPGDALRIRVYREPELSGEYQINELPTGELVVIAEK